MREITRDNGLRGKQERTKDVENEREREDFLKRRNFLEYKD